MDGKHAAVLEDGILGTDRSIGISQELKIKGHRKEIARRIRCGFLSMRIELNKSEVGKDVEKDSASNDILPVHRDELFQLRALCDEILAYLCQAKALLEPISQEDFFNRRDVEVLRHYFYAQDTLLEDALSVRDKMCRVMTGWEKRT